MSLASWGYIMEDNPPGRSRAQRATSLAAARRKLWKEFPAIIDTLIEQSKEGNATAIKALLELSGLEKGVLAARKSPGRQPKSIEQKLLEKFRKRQAERAAHAG